MLQFFRRKLPPDSAGADKKVTVRKALVPSYRRKGVQLLLGGVVVLSLLVLWRVVRQEQWNQNSCSRSYEQLGL